MAPRVVSLTMNPSLDMSATVERVTANNKLRTGQPRREPGGGGLNVAVVAHRLGVDVTAVVTCGGAIGEMLVEVAGDRGVRCRPVPVAGVTRENPTFAEEGSDDQYRFVLPGPELTDDEWRAAVDAVVEADPEVLVASGSLPPGVPDEFYARLVEALPDACRTIVDTSGAALEAAAGAGGVHLLKPNARELAQLHGGSLDHEGAFEEAADRLVADGAAEIVVLSLGSAGVYLARRGEDGVRIPAPTVPIASRIGAGDSTVAGIVVGLARGWDVVDAVRLGVAAGAAAVMTEGSELARAEDVEALYARMTDRTIAGF